MLTIKKAQYCPHHPRVKLLFAGVNRSLNAVRFVCPLCEITQEHTFATPVQNHNLSTTALAPLQRGVAQRAPLVAQQTAHLMAEKILREVFRLSQVYGQPMPVGFDDLLHDFTLMIRYDDLERVRLLFHGAQRRTLLEYTYRLEKGTVLSTVPHDPVGGVSIASEPYADC